LVELERRRLQAADLFEQGVRRSRIAEVFGVTRQAVHVWHRAWEEGGRDALLSRGPGGSSYLSAGQEKELDGLLRAGAVASGFEDQRWTLARVRQVVQDRFGVMYSVAGAWFLLDRLGWSWQVPARRAIKRDEEAIAAWRTDTWPAVSHPGRSKRVEGGSASKTRPAPG
jgi:transposase